MRIIFSVAMLLVASIPSFAQEVEVDLSACRGMYAVLKAMRDGAPRADVEAMLDQQLETRAYVVMFKHYNRSWRPDHLPKAVFRNMILGLRYDSGYAPGRNERADAMRVHWKRYYDDLSLYEQKLQRLESADLQKLIRDGVRYAQTWLPPEWKIPPFYFPVVPNGGSPAFTIEDAQGYDFFQLRDDVPWLVGTISHESHHLGLNVTEPPSLSKRDSLAFRVLTLTLPEGTATKFISGPPAACVPALAEVPFRHFDDDLVRAWNEHAAKEKEIFDRLLELLDQALSGELTDDALQRDLREYWLNGKVGRAYVLGSEIFGAIYYAFGKEVLFAVMRDPRRTLQMYNAALDAMPKELGRCIRVPEKSVKQSLSIGVPAD